MTTGPDESLQPDEDQPGQEEGAQVVPFPSREPADALHRPEESDTSLEVELDPEPEHGPEAVDDGIGYMLDDEPDVYPVIPDFLRSVPALRQALARTGGRAAHLAAFHPPPAPLYAAR